MYNKRAKYQPKHDDIDRLFSTLKQCVRDWSVEVLLPISLFRNGKVTMIREQKNDEDATILCWKGFAGILMNRI
jgi:hypothetical protein